MRNFLGLRGSIIVLTLIYACNALAATAPASGLKEYRVMVPPADAQAGYIDRPRELDWSYAVLNGARFPNLKEINAWLRVTTLKTLFEYSAGDGDMREVAAMSDGEIVKLLKITRTDLLAVNITVEYAFGNNIVASLRSEVMGTAHSSVFKRQVIFNANEGREVDVFSYFKRGKTVIEELRQLIDDSVNKEDEGDKEDQSDSATYCENRELLWDQMKIFSPTEIFVPYESDWRFEMNNNYECAKDGESVKGAALTNMFRSPKMLSPLFK